MYRRHFVQHLMATVAGGGVCTPAFRSLFELVQKGQANPHFFLFAFANGGWDITQVFESDKEGLPTVDVPTGQRTQFGQTVNDTFWDDPAGRPAVTQFFQDFGDRSAIINGIYQRTVSHSLGRELMMTGKLGENAADWPTQIAARRAVDKLLPHLAMSGPSFTGSLGGIATSGSSFNRLVSPDGYSAGETQDNVMENYLSSVLDELAVEAGEHGFADGRINELEDGYNRFEDIKAAGDSLNISGNGFTEQALSAITAFQNGLSVTATVRLPGGYDTHGDNDMRQGQNFQNSFMGLNTIVTELANRAGTTGTGSMLDQTTVCLVSEFARTPKLNGNNGKDHWPTTSCIVVGGGIDGGRVLGASDDSQNAVNVDFTTGLPDPDNGIELNTAHLGAALLALAGVDPAEVLPGVPVFSPLLDLGA